MKTLVLTNVPAPDFRLRAALRDGGEVSPAATSFARALLERRPEKRLSARQAFDHQFMSAAADRHEGESVWQHMLAANAAGAFGLEESQMGEDTDIDARLRDLQLSAAAFSSGASSRKESRLRPWKSSATEGRRGGRKLRDGSETPSRRPSEVSTSVGSSGSV
jgi:hypothetical protein